MLRRSLESAFTDLKEHRHQVIEAIQKLGYRANGMEYVGPRADADLIESSLQLVRDSAAYVGVISRKYGQTPDSTERNPDELSITELEFNEATRLGRPILLFIMGEKHLVTEADVELDRKKRKKLDAFRQRAKRTREGSEVERVYQVFDSLEQFSSQAAIAIGRLAEYIERGEYTFQVKGNLGAKAARLNGNFNNPKGDFKWVGFEMERVGNGLFKCSLPLTPGKYEFKLEFGGKWKKEMNDGYEIVRGRKGNTNYTVNIY